MTSPTANCRLWAHGVARAAVPDGPWQGPPGGATTIPATAAATQGPAAGLPQHLHVVQAHAGEHVSSTRLPGPPTLCCCFCNRHGHHTTALVALLPVTLTTTTATTTVMMMMMVITAPVVVIVVTAVGPPPAASPPVADYMSTSPTVAAAAADAAGRICTRPMSGLVARGTCADHVHGSHLRIWLAACYGGLCKHWGW